MVMESELWPCRQMLTSLFIELLQHLADNLSDALQSLDILLRTVEIFLQALDLQAQVLELGLPLAGLDELGTVRVKGGLALLFRRHDCWLVGCLFISIGTRIVQFAVVVVSGCRVAVSMLLGWLELLGCECRGTLFGGKLTSPAAALGCALPQYPKWLRQKVGTNRIGSAYPGGRFDNFIRSFQGHQRENKCKNKMCIHPCF